MTTALSHYAVLNLAPPTRTGKGNTTATTEEIKHAYHKALLAYHPDKTQPQNPSDRTPLSQPAGQQNGRADITVDDIKSAYKVLVNERTRRDYDRKLLFAPSRLDRDHGAITAGGERGGVGAENIPSPPLYGTFDLDDLQYRERDAARGGGGGGGGLWSHACRCGAEVAYEVTEDQLERYSALGEVLVPCQGCSLWIKVLFEALDGDGEEVEGSG
jgi:DnaJ-class molecular chaperone